MSPSPNQNAGGTQKSGIGRMQLVSLKDTDFYETRPIYSYNIDNRWVLHMHRSTPDGLSTLR